MKIRNGFVSNSSSTSFVFKPGKYTVDKLEQFLTKTLAEYNLIEDEHYIDEHTFEIKLVDDEFITTVVHHFDSEWDDKTNKWIENTKQLAHYKKEWPKGSIVVSSVNDNSIPFEIQEQLENKGAARVHFG